MSRPPLLRRLLAEFVGTGLLVAVVVGSGIMAQRLSPGDIGLELLENSLVTAMGLAVIILVTGPVSGAHLNPVVSLADWVIGRHDRSGLPLRDIAAYIPVQIAGAISGAVLANLMFALPAATASTKVRSGGHLWLGEVVATAGLIAVIFALSRSGNSRIIPAAVGGWIGAAYWFTSSTSFANPAVTIGRAFTDTFAGIKPSDVFAFIVFQVVGTIAGVALVEAFYPVRSAVVGTGALPDSAPSVVVSPAADLSPGQEGLR
jgi:glycerol uptake facilitator-like aquaporin